MKFLFPVLLSSVFSLNGLSQNIALPKSKHSFTVIAHRGDHVDVPENTLASFEKAIMHDVDYVELDLRTTKDGALVVMHDATVDRMTNGKGKVNELTYAQIRELTVSNKEKISDNKTYKIPSFEEALQTCSNKIYIYLDFKDASVDQTFSLIKKYQMEDEVIVYINSAQQYTDWRNIAPTMPLMVSLPDSITSRTAITSFLKLNPVAVLDGDYEGYNSDVITAAKDLNIKIWPDIQSPTEDKNWEEAIEKGFTGLQTDHPEALISYLKTKKLR